MQENNSILYPLRSVYAIPCLVNVTSLNVSLNVCVINTFWSFQVWFQNRRAKFRRNERNLMAQRQSIYGRSPENTPIEQPITPRPSPMNSDYLSWPTPPSYSPVTTSSSCALANHSYSPPPNVGSSIACLRLKAQEYNTMHHTPYGHQMSQWDRCPFVMDYTLNYVITSCAHS